MASVGRRLQSALAAFLLAAVLGAHAVAAQATVNYSKFLLFFQLLDQSGAIAKEFAAADGDLCKVKGITCEAGQVTIMCVPHKHVPALIMFHVPCLAARLEYIFWGSTPASPSRHMCDLLNGRPVAFAMAPR
jgi:hypothetical protein